MITDRQTCRDHIHQMLYWENEDSSRGVVHHLMVLCYHLQHPSFYSVEGLALSRQLLVDFVERGLSLWEARRNNRERVASGKRDWSITARPGNQGAYERPITWTMTAADVVAAGAERYCECVRLWAREINDSLCQCVDDP
ncbi:MAG: hypothetical protein KBF17_11920 [Candidatus Promineofilum sp.]|nr:hypothetical protein [Promineifilum sp.]